MHIPDGFLSAQTSISTWVISIAGLGYCLKKTSRELKDRMVPLMGVMSAFIFAAQMLNFPVVGGTSGHLLGSVLACVMLGPYAGALIMTVVLTAQCLIFQDGGLTALGANMFNMSLLACWSGYFIYWVIHKSQKRKNIISAVAVAAWSSVVLSSAAAAFELAISGTSPLKIVLPAMVGIHALIGAGEAIITSFVLAFILKVRPDLVYRSETKPARLI